MLGNTRYGCTQTYPAPFSPRPPPRFSPLSLRFPLFPPSFSSFPPLFSLCFPVSPHVCPFSPISPPFPPVFPVFPRPMLYRGVHRIWVLLGPALWGQFQSSYRAVTGDSESGWGAVTGGWKCGWGWGTGMPLGQKGGRSLWGGGCPPPPPNQAIPPHHPSSVAPAGTWCPASRARSAPAGSLRGGGCTACVRHGPYHWDLPPPEMYEMWLNLRSSGL